MIPFVRKGIDGWTGDEGCQRLIKEDNQSSVTDGQANTYGKAAIPSPRAIVVESEAQNIDNQNRKEVGSQRGRLVWGSQMGSGDWRLGSFGIVMWGSIVCFSVFSFWRLKRNHRSRRQARKRWT